MNLTRAIEGGLTGTGMLTVLQEVLHKIDGKSPRPILHQSGLFKKLKKHGSGSGLKTKKLYVQLAGELLSNAAYFGLTGLGKKKNAVMRGGLLGAAAGLGSVILRDDEENAAERKTSGNMDNPSQKNGIFPLITLDNELKDKFMTVSLYTIGGLLAGVAVKKMNQKKKKKRKK